MAIQSIQFNCIYYCLPTKLREGNVFPSRMSVCPHGGGGVPMWLLQMMHWTSLYSHPLQHLRNMGPHCTISTPNSGRLQCTSMRVRIKLMYHIVSYNSIGIKIGAELYGFTISWDRCTYKVVVVFLTSSFEETGQDAFSPMCTYLQSKTIMKINWALTSRSRNICFILLLNYNYHCTLFLKRG